MKIVTRQKLLQKYEDKYNKIITDPEERLRSFFEEKGYDFEKARKKAEDKLIKICEQRTYSVIKVILYEYPMKTDRPRTFNGHTFSPNARQNKEYLGKNVKKIKKILKLVNTPSKITINAYLEMPNNVPPDEILLYECGVLDVLDTPDYDNISKCYTDMLKDILISDDDIFYKAIVTKYYSTLPRVEVIIRYQDKHDSDYIYKKLKIRKSIKDGIEKGLIELKKL